MFKGFLDVGHLPLVKVIAARHHLFSSLLLGSLANAHATESSCCRDVHVQYLEPQQVSPSAASGRSILGHKIAKTPESLEGIGGF